MGSYKPAKSIRPKRPRVSKSKERLAYRKARDERIASHLLAVQAAATMVRDAYATNNMLQVHITRHVLIPLAACICVLSPETALDEPHRKGGSK
jgi:hypothetical protein